jgi:hypothetical protein
LKFDLFFFFPEREAEKQRLLRHNSELKLEKDTLEKRAAELSAAVMVNITLA